MEKDYGALLDGFMSVVRTDARISTTACCLYLVLLYFLKRENGLGQVMMSRSEVLQILKICRTTFQRSIKELEDIGYIEYLPSFNPFLGSVVTFKSFEQSVMNIVIDRDEILLDISGNERH